MTAEERRQKEYREMVDLCNPPLMISQTLEGAVDEFIIAVRKLEVEFNGMSVIEAQRIALELRRLCQPREVR